MVRARNPRLIDSIESTTTDDDDAGGHRAALADLLRP
jgi:hypothetical protein